MEKLKEWIEETEKGVRVVIGDFNTGREGREVKEEEVERGEEGRRSKDKKMNGKKETM